MIDRIKLNQFPKDFLSKSSCSLLHRLLPPAFDISFPSQLDAFEHSISPLLFMRVFLK